MSSPPQPALQVMRQDVLHAAACGAAGVVLGALTPEGEVHVGQVKAFVDLAAALGECLGVACSVAGGVPAGRLPWAQRLPSFQSSAGR